ncbi:DUF2150 family protein [Haloferax mediterranei ATCC 33500]|uniref:DUF2150 family protein n=1 Tax=Haloferax mediterranei (strain ATCC 33500 / DSM 1411 / JCM 8866 / NBRC 14739 / NCIMB 2177 / R-4) TaxID=523841 RepID=I3R797_HALMT|nr:DUF2150 family protein [Haloferax mediterranei]AFK20107.1 hypothetical protein HFX_2422 [Haloferax mediterranei ATCC 33500]AHZ23481.1 hypothetical protein BM92_12895 [Haloferax mediterranei ATCC 33500]ELZ99653.1 hypothetical protein C439_13904 [Haloferax mediterranei ATCC 33500]MDX5987143.1 DUF2150 family protein [Haloferax mediterranei ATCC 33500]QCQ76456.1 DUF2150 family protein [Haloferax mediterranei ATCC 33500]
MTEAEERYYSPERWQNWLTRVEEEDLDLESEETGRLLMNVQNDAAIAIAKILTAYDDDTLDEEEALDELATVHDIVMAEAEFESENEEAEILIGSVQTSLSCAFFAAEEYLVAGPAELEDDMEAYVLAAADAEEADDLDSALGYIVQVGTRVIDGDELDIEVLDELEFGLVTEWVNGLDSLQSGLSEPEVVEEED